MSIYKELSYEQDIDIVKGIQFSVLSPDEILRRSVVEVVKTETYSGNEPVVGGLFDPRMGVLENNRYCRTCQQKNIFCPGHFGHITLSRPMFHAMFFDVVRKVMQCTCYRCSRVLVRSTTELPDFQEKMKLFQNKKLSAAKRWDIMYDMCTSPKIKKCGDDKSPGCGAKQPYRYNKENVFRLYAEWKDENKETIRKEMTAEEVLRVFKRMTEEDMELLGFSPQWNRPEWMILTVLQVPPPAVRPSVTNDNGQRCEDDLTHKLSDTIKTNKLLKARIDKGNASEEHLENLSQLLQFHVATYFDNQIPGLPPAQQRNGRRLKSISDRLKKKEGRIRGNLNGKRVDQSARSVITPDPVICIDELGVPIRVAMTLTFPEVVNMYNIEKMRAMVLRGPDEHPGAKYIRKSKDGRTITLKIACREKLAMELEEGDIIDRHLCDGDYVLFNRQPSLHRMSMMCHRARIMPYQTFRLNPSVCKPYNADFDGDEMNMHQPQSIQTMCELMDFAAVPYHIITPKDGKNIIDFVQDTMLASFRLTKDHIRIRDKSMANLQMVNSYFDGKIQKPMDGASKMYSGRQAYSALLPPGLMMESKNRLGQKVIVYDGELKEGILDKSVFNSMSDGLIPRIFHDYGPFEARRFMDNTQRLMSQWLMLDGFSCGISDLVIEPNTVEKIKTILGTMKNEAYHRIQEVRNGGLDNHSIFKNNDFFEMELISKLQKAFDEIGSEGLKQIDDLTNRMINMVKAGSKGSEMNVAQMIGALGQQLIDGKRIQYGFTDRTLPHYTKFDDGPDARGFVQNSFIQGLEPHEVFFHAMGGREGLIDTAVKTSETGYIQRRLVKAMEDCKVYYDNSVRNATGAIVQFIYGEDGMDGTKLEQQHIPYIQQSLLEMDLQYNLRKSDIVEFYFTKEAFGEIEKGGWEERCTELYEEMVADREFLITKVFKLALNNTITYPIPFKRILRTATMKINQLGLDKTPTSLTPIDILNAIDALKEKLFVAHKEQGIAYIHLLLRIYLNPKTILLTHHLSKPVFEWVVSEIERYFKCAIAQPGETVGIIAAQSIGEPSTQLSTHKHTVIRVLGEENYSGFVSTFIDNLLEKYAKDVIHIDEGSVVLDMVDDYHIIGVSDTEKTSWKRISQISRHYANGRLMTVHTRSGKKTTATMSHSFLKRTVDKIVPIEGTNLKLGDRIPVAKYIPEMENPQTNIMINSQSFKLDKAFGWIIGAYLADGSINGNTVTITKIEPVFEANIRAFAQLYGYDIRIRMKKGHIQGSKKIYESKDTSLVGASAFGKWLKEQFNTGSYEKRIPAWVYGTSKDFISGIVSGYFDGDGNVNADIGKQCIRAHSVNEGLVDDMIVLLAYCGIFANKNIERRNREVSNKFYVAMISKKYAKQFNESVGLQTPHKWNNLLQIIDYNQREERHSEQEAIDKIPELGDVIAFVGKRLKLPGQSRNYGRWKHKESIGRRTLECYIKVFEEANAKENYKDVAACIDILRQAALGDVIWDEIIHIEYHEDPKEFVYDFTVPGNDSFMVDTCVLVHNTLNSFHSSGTAAAVKATSGVPRLRELLSVSKNIKTPTLLIYLQPDIAPYKDKAESILKSLEMTKLGDLLEMSEIFWDPPGNNGLNTGIAEDKGILDIYHTFSELEGTQSNSPWVLRMKLNKQKLYRAGLSMQDIYMRLMSTNGTIVDCVFSDDNSTELILRIRLTEVGLKDIDPEDSVAALKAIEYNFIHGIGNSPLLLKGMQGIRKVSMRQQNIQRYNPVIQDYEKIAEWVLDTDGSNLMDILSNRNVDAVRTISNDVREIFDVLGIEAARMALFNEIYNVIRESSVNPRHLYMLVDTITNRGNLMSIDRHGINRADVGPLAKSSFEETTDMLIKAGIFSEFDRINGVSANIMLGQLPPCGTGDSEILLDEELFMQLIQQAVAPAELPPTPEAEPPAESYSMDNISFSYKLPTPITTQYPMPQIIFT